MIAHNDGSPWYSCLCDECDRIYQQQRRGKPDKHRRDSISPTLTDTKMKLDQMYPSNYLGKEDFPEPKQCTITTVDMVDIKSQSGTERKPVMFFQGSEKGLILNRTNANICVMLFGADTADWRGCVVEVYHDPTISFGHEVTGGVRMRKAEPQISDKEMPF